MIVSAYREQEERWRIERLKKELLPLIEGLPILGLHDCKSCLSVNWAHCPSTKDLRQVIDAWEKCNEYNSNHYVDGEMIIEDEGGPKVWSDLSCEPYSDAATLNCPAMLRHRDDRDTDELGLTIKREKSVFQCPNSQPTCLCFVPILGHSAFKNFLQRINKPKCRLLVCLRLKMG